MVCQKPQRKLLTQWRKLRIHFNLEICFFTSFENIYRFKTTRLVKYITLRATKTHDFLEKKKIIITTWLKTQVW